MVTPQHPGLRCNEARPIGKGGDRAKILTNVLLADEADRNSPAVSIDDRRPEQGFQHEDALGMVPERAVPGVCEDGLGLVEPLVQRQIVVGLAAPFPD